VQLHVARLEPVGDLLDVLAAGVVEVLACGKDLNGLRATAGQGVEEAGVETLAEEGMSGEGSERGWVPLSIFSLRTSGLSAAIFHAPDGDAPVWLSPLGSHLSE
jgi:hypothetical protein